MPHTIPLRAAALALCFSTALAQAVPKAGRPELRHKTAPFLGRTLTLELRGAAPNSPIELYFSTEADSRATPYGRLELRHNRMRLLDSGTTSAGGSWCLDLAVPLEESLAETGAHFQALVADPTAVAGKVFSDAIHARFLGPRVYARFAASGGGMYIVSGVTDEIVARVDYLATGSWTGYQDEGKPVFDAAFSRGAGLSTQRELVFFDPFFGGILGRVAFASDCSGTLFTDATRRTIFLLELAGASAPARIHAIDFASGAKIAHLDLPNAVEPLWCLGRASSEVFVAEHEPDGRTAVRWVGLGPLVDRGSAQIGTPGSNKFTDYDGTRTILLPMTYASGQVFASTYRPGSPFFESSLTRCRAGAGTIATDVLDLGTSRFYRLAAIPSTDRVLAGWGRTDTGPFFFPAELPLSKSGPPTSIVPPHGSTAFFIRDIEPDGSKAWVVAEWEWQHSDILYRLDMTSHTWTEYPHFWLYGPNDAELLRDAWNHELWVSNQSMDPPIDIDPEILVVDELHGTSRHIPLEHAVEVMHAVPLP